MSEIPEFLELQQVIAYLKNLRSRGEIKRWGKWLEKSDWYDGVLTVVCEIIESKKIPILEINIDGAKSIRARANAVSTVSII